jgi:acyl phosphate:glycerol-3-phosphate acyltransferase
MNIVLVLAAAYLLGSIPFGYIIGRMRGIDITQSGSGNIGATNAFRILGPGAGAAVLVLDGAKAALATYLGRHVGGTEAITLLAAATAVLGHSFSPFMNFKGGRGVACAAGILLYLMPLVMVTLLVIWIIIIAVTRYVSLASIVIAVLLPVLIWWNGRSSLYILFGFLMAVFVIYKHRPNIERLLAGTEHRFGEPRP